jgi:short-subunit dehydrogenase
MKKNNLAIVITGISNETGRAAAIEFAKKGHKIALASRHKDILDDLARQCRAFGAETFERVVNMSMQNEVDEFAKQVHDLFHGFDVWINNSSEPASGSINPSLSNEQIQTDTSVLRYLYGARAALGYFRNQGYGMLINVASHYDDTNQPLSMSNTKTHAAVLEITTQLQEEVQQYEYIDIEMISAASLPQSSSASQVASDIVSLMVQHIDVMSDRKREQALGQHENDRMKNILWIGLAVAGVVAGAAAIYYLSKDNPKMSFSKLTENITPLLKTFYSA